MEYSFKYDKTHKSPFDKWLDFQLMQIDHLCFENPKDPKLKQEQDALLKKEFIIIKWYRQKYD